MLNYLEGQGSVILVAASPGLIFLGITLALVVLCSLLFGRAPKIFLNFTIILAVLLASYVSFGPMELATIFVNKLE